MKQLATPKTLQMTHFFFPPLAASPALVCTVNKGYRKNQTRVVYGFYKLLINKIGNKNFKGSAEYHIRMRSTEQKMCFTFFTPRIFLALFFLSFSCFLDFSTLVSSPFCNEMTDLGL